MFLNNALRKNRLLTTSVFICAIHFRQVIFGTLIAVFTLFPTFNSYRIVTVKNFAYLCNKIGISSLLL